MKNFNYIFLTFLLIFGLSANDLMAQRMRHGGGRSSMSRSTGSHQMNRSSGAQSINGGANRNTTSRPKTSTYSRPKTSTRKST